MDLLLAHDDGTPFLNEQPDPRSAAGEARQVATQMSEYLASITANANDLTEQRWAIVVPEGPAGQRLEALVRPLVERRAEDQQEDVLTIRVPPGMDATAAQTWKGAVYPGLHAHREKKRPRYLLILGDLDGVSLDTQHALATDGLPGRLVCPTDEGYEAYVHKALAWQRKPSPHGRARALFYTVHDGTSATRSGYEKLIQPCHALCAAEQREEPRKFLASAVEDHGGRRPDPGELLDLVAERHPSVLFSMSHGMGPPRRRSWSPAEARELQGAMCFGSEGPLRPSDVAKGPFLPGGLWFYFACFGAGVPGESAYRHWLDMLAQHGMAGLGNLQAVLQGLAAGSGFTSGIAQAALANPDGPLAVLGHVDLAWSCSYEVPGEGAGSAVSGSNRPRGFFRLLEGLLGRDHHLGVSGRAGAAMLALQLYLGEASRSLNERYDACKKQGLEPEGASDAERLALGNLWMLRQDLLGYVLLGDPAVHLPLARPDRDSDPYPDPDLDPDPDPARLDRIEEAIFALASGSRSLSEVSAELDVASSRTRRWERAYRDAGRQALARLLLETDET
jgi:hypothetical protein